MGPCPGKALSACVSLSLSLSLSESCLPQESWLCSMGQTYRQTHTQADTALTSSTHGIQGRYGNGCACLCVSVSVCL